MSYFTFPNINTSLPYASKIMFFVDWIFAIPLKSNYRPFLPYTAFLLFIYIYLSF